MTQNHRDVLGSALFIIGTLLMFGGYCWHWSAKGKRRLKDMRAAARRPRGA